MDEQVRNRVQDFLSEVKQIPTLPDVYMRLQKAFEDPWLSVEYISNIIRLDQTLTIAILRLANSPFFGFRKKISSITQAVMLIGLREVYSLVLSISVMGIFPLKEAEQGNLFPAKKLWEHCLAVGVTSRILGKMTGYGQPEELFVAGLIHDIGKLVEKMYLGEKFTTICQRSREEERPFLEIESEVLGFTHAEVGEMLANMWGFPSLLVSIVACHHQPEQLTEPKVADAVAIVHVADVIVRAMRIGWGGDPFVPPVSPEALVRLPLLNAASLENIVCKVRQEYETALRFLTH